MNEELESENGWLEKKVKQGKEKNKVLKMAIGKLQAELEEKKTGQEKKTGEIDA